MFSFFESKKSIHEPIENQIADIKKLNPLIANEILKGMDCDRLPNATGDFGSLNNPIPVNGVIGEIKYLGKLRGKTGHALFFHRIGSASSPISDNPVDIFEVVCQDATQWNRLYFDFYHPRRSNYCPNGYTLVQYNKNLKMDLPFGYGVTYIVNNFPLDLPAHLDDFYGSKGVYSRHAKKWLENYSFNKPYKKIEEDISSKQKDSTQKESISEKEADELRFITNILKHALEKEKELLKNQKSKLNGYSNPKIFDGKFYVKFLIERFIFLRAFLEFNNLKLVKIDDILPNVVSSASKKYNISNQQAIEYIENRKKFYVTELELLKKAKYPHPGKIVWCLENPTNDTMGHDFSSGVEDNYIAASHILQTIFDAFSSSLQD